ncbi:Probable Lipase [Sorangium cellulosum So ce56]|uniref:Probable Lipase n=1 Tax=Sorangium cellulosum (strain So ce56) TaxID=448385 RepID=A9FWL1_SORC5|nr:lipase family protein [Sorangium cellulosum]CAN92390.1 Probable Lipase [Sorangium cellulosum So ce56]
MRIETVVVGGRRLRDESGREQSSTPVSERAIALEDHLLKLKPMQYDRQAAELLAMASAWAYSDPSTFAYAMHRRGLENLECADISLTNDPLLVDTTVRVVQSYSGKLAILCCRGTMPRNAINWMTDVSARMHSFYSRGRVHGGFSRAIQAVVPHLVELSKPLKGGRSICEATEQLRNQYMVSCRDEPPRRAPGSSSPHTPVGSGGTPGEEPPTSGPAGARRVEPVEALYITGHSLGGAVATLAAAIVYADHRFEHYRPLLKGVYTFGQPMVGDATFAEEFKDDLGKNLFRHVYNSDIVPRFPSRAMGRFAPLGRQYVSSNEGWVLRPAPVRAAWTLLLSNFLGVTSFLTQEVFSVNWLRLPFSWQDHSPLNYMRTSMLAPPGAEFE